MYILVGKLQVVINSEMLTTFSRTKITKLHIIFCDVSIFYKLLNIFFIF